MFKRGEIMKAIMVMYDSLNRRMLSPYGCDWIKTPNFERLAKKTVVFDNSYAGSLPCMPARREIHTGRYNFLHRSWGPVEPFDDSMPEILKENGIYSHLISDHYHYWEDGGATYHMRYNSWEMVRGQEGDNWKGEVKDPMIPDTVSNTGRNRSYWVNRKYMKDEKTHYQTKTFDLGLEFIEKNCNEDNWFLHLETFDPHEPYFSPQLYKALYPHDYDGKHFDWPPYRKVNEKDSEISHVIYENVALVSMCDYNLGRVLDMMDEKNMWEDTMLIVNTDHGFLLGEHGCWAKSWAPFYNEVAHTPLFIWDPRVKAKGERRKALVQTIDLAPTLLDYFEIGIPKDMQGKPLQKTVLSDRPVRKAALFGIHGGHVNCTDGRYVYMRGIKEKENKPLYQYTLMPTGHGSGRAFIDIDELKTIQLAGPFSFTKGIKVMKIESQSIKKTYGSQCEFKTMLFDLQSDPAQLNTIEDPNIENCMIDYMKKLMRENDCPEEQFMRLGLK